MELALAALMIINIVLSTAVLVKLSSSGSRPVQVEPPKDAAQTNAEPADFFIDEPWNPADHRLGNWAQEPPRAVPRNSANNLGRPSGFAR